MGAGGEQCARRPLNSATVTECLPEVSTRSTLSTLRTPDVAEAVAGSVDDGYQVRESRVPIFFVGSVNVLPLMHMQS